jgi:RimJ/RimL family protein N-acetyltransferase
VIHFERSFDYELIRRIITHRRIYPHVSDDGSPPANEYRPIESDGVWYVVVRDIYPDAGAQEILGLWIFHPHTSICWEIHTALLPNAWGERGQCAARLLPDWIWKHTPCRRIITSVPASNRLALHFAFRAGMKAYGVNEASILQNGRLCDQVCLGISAPPQSRTEAGDSIKEAIHEEKEA